MNQVGIHGVHLFILIAGIALTVAGAWLARRSWFPARTGQTPYCRRCNYILIGIPTADRCPECGSALSSKSIVNGERRPRRVLAVCALFLCLLGVASTVATLNQRFRSIDWYQYKPSSWVISDLKSKNPVSCLKAWLELQDRITRGKFDEGNREALDDAAIRLSGSMSNEDLTVSVRSYLFDGYSNLSKAHQDTLLAALCDELMAPESPSYKTQTTIFAFPYEADRFVEGLIERHLLSTAQEQKLVESALRVQRSQVSAWGERLLLTFLGDQELAGKLNDAQRRQFFNQISVKMRARPVGVAGTKLPYTIEFRGRGPEVGWRLDFEILYARIDGKAASIGMYRTGGGFASGASSSVYVSEPGAHSLEFEGQLRIFSERDIGPNGDPDDTTQRMSRDVHLSADFYAFPVDSPDAVDWVTEPSSEVLKRHIQVSRLDSRGDGKQWVLSINLANLPEDIAFKVLARSAGKEFVLGEISGNRGESIGHGIFADNPLPEAKIDRVDIILRSDAAVALDKIDLLVPWKGSLVYESIPVSTDDK